MHDDHDISPEPEPGHVQEPGHDQGDSQGGAEASTASIGLSALVARHLDGGLDAAEQRDLARQLASSAAARRILAEYLRLEAALVRLGLAGELTFRGKSPPWPFSTSAPPENAEGFRGCDSPHPAAGRGPDRQLTGGGKSPPWPFSTSAPPENAEGFRGSARGAASAKRLRRSAVVTAVGIAVGLVLVAAVLPRREAGGPGDVGGDIDRVAAAWLQTSRQKAAADSPDAAPPSEGAGEEPDAGADAGPPSWLVAAMADEEFRRTVPDPG